MYRVELLTTAQHELDEIASVHMKLVGPISAQKISDQIYNSLEKLEVFPDMGIECRDKYLAALGYRMLISGDYLCFYRLIGEIVYVYHIVDGRSDYPKLLSDLK